MSRSKRETIVKLIIVSTTAGILVNDIHKYRQQPEIVTEMAPSIMWLAHESRVVADNFTDQLQARYGKDQRKQNREYNKNADRINGAIKELRSRVDQIHTDPPAEGEDYQYEDHAEIWMASAIVMILDDLVQTIRDPKKLEIITPLYEAAVAIDERLDKWGSQYNPRTGADAFVALVYEVIEGADL